MAITLYLTNTTAHTSLGNGVTGRQGTALNWRSPLALSTSIGSSSQSASRATVASDTVGYEFDNASRPYHWLSPPLAADVTISGTVQFHMCGYENNMSANTAFGCLVQKLNPRTMALSTIIDSIDDAEAATSQLNNDWSGSPTSTTVYKGECIRVVPCMRHWGTEAVGYFLYLYWNGPAAGYYDSYVGFAETPTFMDLTTFGQQMFLTDVASALDTADVDKAIWKGRGT